MKIKQKKMTLKNNVMKMMEVNEIFLKEMEKKNKQKLEEINRSLKESKEIKSIINR